jgi:hypothetical protein
VSHRLPLVLAAGVNVALHIGGVALALVGMRPGSPVMPLDERQAYLASHPLLWSLGWGVWMSCALALVAFLAMIATRADDPALASLAVSLAVAGAAVDLLCDIGQIVVLPDLASWKPPQPAVFLSWERWLGAGGTVAANGLYSCAVLLASLAVRVRVPPYVLALAIATWSAGMWMVVAGFTGDPRQLEISVGPTFVAFVAWTLAITRGLVRSERAA